MLNQKVIAIGAVGGSGTRAVAKIFMDAGVFMGDDLNASNDDLTFTRLFKNPAWYNNATKPEVKKRLRIFEKHMTGIPLTLSERKEFQKAAETNNLYFSYEKYIADTLFSAKGFSQKKRTVWGWKEPNTQIFIEDIAEYFSNLKYIHVLRHGLDMAFSRNRQQVNNWGERFNIVIGENDTDDQIATKQLDYWIKSNTSTINQGKKLLGENFYVLYLHELIANPKEEIERLLKFAGVKCDQDLISKLKEIPQKQNSYGRYKNENTSIFSDEQKEAVEQLGFHV